MFTCGLLRSNFAFAMVAPFQCQGPIAGPHLYMAGDVLRLEDKIKRDLPTTWHAVQLKRLKPLFSRRDLCFKPIKPIVGLVLAHKEVLDRLGSVLGEVL